MSRRVTTIERRGHHALCGVCNAACELWVCQDCASNARRYRDERNPADRFRALRSVDRTRQWQPPAGVLSDEQLAARQAAQRLYSRRRKERKQCA